MKINIKFISLDRMPKNHKDVLVLCLDRTIKTAKRNDMYVSGFDVKVPLSQSSLGYVIGWANIPNGYETFFAKSKSILQDILEQNNISLTLPNHDEIFCQ
jgi:hypothetical protein